MQAAGFRLEPAVQFVTSAASRDDRRRGDPRGGARRRPYRDALGAVPHVAPQSDFRGVLRYVVHGAVQQLPPHSNRMWRHLKRPKTQRVECIGVFFP